MSDHPSRAGSLMLVGGLPALDFANTASGRDGPWALEHLQAPAHLVLWAQHAGVVSAETAAAALDRLPGEEGRAFLRRALEVREAIFRIGTAVTRKDVPLRADLFLLKQEAAHALEQADLEAEAGGAFAIRFGDRPPAAILGPLTQSALSLFLGGGLERLKQCPAPDCGWLFYDRSKNNSRRWCDMATCGNREKAQRFRAGEGRGLKAERLED